MVEIGDRAAAGADRFDGDHRLAQRPAGQRPVGRDFGAAVGDQADVGRGAAHVEADDVIEVELAGDARGGGDAGSGAGHGEPERQIPERLRGRHAAGGVEQVNPRAGRGALGEGVEIAGGERHDARAQDRGRGPLVLARFGIDAIGQRHVGKATAQPLAEPFFMRGIGIGVDQRHGDGLGPALFCLADRSFRVGVRERLEDLPIRVEPFVYLEAAFGRNERRKLRQDVEAIELTPVLPSDGERVGKPPGRNQRDLGEMALDDGVGDHRRSVDEIADLRPIESNRGEGLDQAVDLVARSRRDLGDPGLAQLRPDRNDVGEGSADVDSNPPSGIGGCRALNHRRKPCLRRRARVRGGRTSRRSAAR